MSIFFFSAILFVSISIIRNIRILVYLFMQKDIHPKYFEAAEVVCACGNKFTVGSTKEKIHVEICSACHPFYSGNEKVIDTAGRVERFKARATKTAAKVKKSATKA